MSSTAFGGSALSPRRRRTRPDWNKEHQQQHCLSDRSLSPPPLPSSRSLQQRQQHSSSPFLTENFSATRPLPLSSTRAEPSSLSHSSKTRNVIVAVLITTGLLVVLLLASANTNIISVDVIRDLETHDETQLALRRRLMIPSSRSEGWWTNETTGIPGAEANTDYHKNRTEYPPKGLNYLSFGGPLTYGRGLEKVKRSSEAYPYWMTSKDRVHNVAHPTYQTTGPTMASMCTQSIVEGTSGGLNNPSASLSSPSIEYDVITLEYSFASTASTKEAFLSSIALLVKRLRQRYPLAEILLVQIWTPSDLVYHDKTSNSKISYNEWRRNQNQQQQQQQPAWTFRELSQTEQEIEDTLESTMASAGGFVSKMTKPETLIDILDDWFLEESYDEDTATNDGALSLSPSSSSSLRFTLSREGHAIVAKGIRESLRDHQSTHAPRIISPIIPTYSSSSDQLLYSWGSGDSCQFWYDTGKEHLPSHNDYSSGLQSNEIDPSLYALEVRTSTGGALKVHNPFDTDRVVYLTYLTASETAASNKVYPKTKVKMVAEAAEEKDIDHHGMQSQTLSQQQPPSLLGRVTATSMTTSLLLDPSHVVASQHQHQHHFTRTSAVGVLPSLQTGILEFTTLEEYTVHPFRIVGVSILHPAEREGHRVPVEFAMFSPRKLSVDNGVGDEVDDDSIEID